MAKKSILSLLTLLSIIVLIFYIKVYKSNADAQSFPQFNEYQQNSIIVKEAVTTNTKLQKLAKANPKYISLAQNISDDIARKYKNYEFQVYVITGSTKKIDKSQYPSQQFIYIDTKDKLSKFLIKEDNYNDFDNFIRNKSSNLNSIVSQKDPQNSSDQIIVGNNLNPREILPFPSDKGTDLYLEYANNLDVQKYIDNEPQ